jgi:polysaccharide biosynthesis transport protein
VVLSLTTEESPPLASVEPTPVRPTLLADAVRRHAVLIICAALLGLALGLTVGLAKGAQYTASTAVLVNPLDGNPFFPSTRGEQLINMLTEAQLVRSDAVASEVATETGSNDTAFEILENAEVENPPNTQVLNIAYTAPSERVALARSQSFAEQYLLYRQRRADRLVKGEVETLQKEIDKVQKRDDETAADIRAAQPGSVDIALLTEQSRVLGSRLNQLQDRLTEINTTPNDPGQVITPAAIITRPGIVTPLLFGAAGLVSLAALTFLFALTRERADLRIRTESDVMAVGANVLAEVSVGSRPADGSVVDTSPSNDYRRLRAALLSVLPDGPQSVVVTSAGPAGDGPATITGLANAFARSNILTTVVAVGTPLRGMANEVETPSGGLASVLLEQEPVVSALVTVRSGLRMLPAGDDYDAAKDLVVEPAMADIMATLRRLADVVLIGAPTIHEAEGQTVAHLADFVVLEVTKRKTTSVQLESALEECRRASTPVLGVVIVRRRRRRVLRKRLGVAAQPTAEQPIDEQPLDEQPTAEQPIVEQHPVRPAETADADILSDTDVNGDKGTQLPHVTATPATVNGSEAPPSRSAPDVHAEAADREGSWTRT